MDMNFEHIGNIPFSSSAAVSLFPEMKAGKPKELDIWSNEYFLQLAKLIRFD